VNFGVVAHSRYFRCARIRLRAGSARRLRLALFYAGHCALAQLSDVAIRLRRRWFLPGPLLVFSAHSRKKSLVPYWKLAMSRAAIPRYRAALPPRWTRVLARLAREPGFTPARLPS